METGTEATLTDAALAPDGRVVIVGLSGTLLIGSDGARSVSLLPQPSRQGAAGCAGGRGRAVDESASFGVRCVGEGGAVTAAGFVDRLVFGSAARRRSLSSPRRRSLSRGSLRGCGWTPVYQTPACRTRIHADLPGVSRRFRGRGSRRRRPDSRARATCSRPNSSTGCATSPTRCSSCRGGGPHSGLFGVHARTCAMSRRWRTGWRAATFLPANFAPTAEGVRPGCARTSSRPASWGGWWPTTFRARW